MGILDLDGGAFEYQWASDVAFDGIRLEVLTPEGGVLFDVSIPDAGPLTINTFSQEIPADLIVAAIAVARQRR